MRLFSLALQIKHLHLPAVLLLNMADEAPKFGVKIEPNRIAKHLGIPVLPISAQYGDGYDQAVKAIAQTLQQQQEPITARSLAQCSACDSKIASEMSSLLEDAVYTPAQVEENLRTRLDRVLLHPVFGLPLFFAAMFLMFQIVYALGTPVQKFMGDTLDWFKGVALEPLLGGLPPFLKGFLIDGLYGGMGTIAAFISTNWN